MNKRILVIFILSSFLSYSQKKHSYVQADYFYGNILSYSPDANAFSNGHPTGFFASYNIQTTGEKNWQGLYNFPDVGISFGYQNYDSAILGDLYAVYFHYNFYLLKRTSKNQLILRPGIGIAYNTSPYNKETNNKNTAFGTALNSSTYFNLYYQRNYLIGNFGVTAGLKFVHASNANVKSPNSGVNVWGVSAGVNYNLAPKTTTIAFTPSKDTLKTTEPIKINLAFRSGINESPIIGSGVKPFFVTSAYLDKRISRKSAFQLGADLYISPMLKDYYEINQNLPNSNLEAINSYSRVGVFVGYELFINKLSIEGSLGYYVKYPFDFEGRIYETLGFKRYLGQKWFASIRLKVHAANAETVEFGVGVRL